MFVAAIIVAVLAIGAAFYFAPKGWRTAAINVVIGLLTVLSQLIPAIQVALPYEFYGWALAATNIINLILRRITDTPIGKGR